MEKSMNLPGANISTSNSFQTSSKCFLKIVLKKFEMTNIFIKNQIYSTKQKEKTEDKNLYNSDYWTLCSDIGYNYVRDSFWKRGKGKKLN